MNIKIPKLKSCFIPVHSTAYCIRDEIHWWKDSSPFKYPFVLMNLDTATKQQTEEMDIKKNNVFLLTDSGGFQVISGQCNLNWKSSLLKQIELGASKIFSFDKPPVEKKKEIINGQLQESMVLFNEEQTKNIIEQNIDVALKQSEFLKNNYPEELKKFCYIAQSMSLDTFRYNFKKLNEKIGMENFSKYFPGGLVTSCKTDDLLLYTMIARYLYEKFIKKDIYVHFLGMGSFYRLIMMIRNEITTFDSSNALRGTISWQMYNPLSNTTFIKITEKEFAFKKQFCLCPVCSKIDYNKLIEDEKAPLVGRWLIGHNVWQILQINVFLDSLKKEFYTKTLKDYFKLPENVINCLEFCDECDKNDFDIMVDKYKHYLKKDKTKQNSLF